MLRVPADPLTGWNMEVFKEEEARLVYKRKESRA
jgi:hypothetical protein